MAGGTPVLMPKLGHAMAEGTVVTWHVKEGAHVEQGAPLVTIETEKASYDLEAQASGVVHILVPEGREAPVGAVIAEIGGPAAAQARPDSVPVARGATGTATPLVAPQRATAGRNRPLASPKARRLAQEHGIDLVDVTPSGADGVISAEDVERAVEEMEADAPVAVVHPTHPGAARRGARERRPLTGLRKTAARRLQEAWRTIPHIVQMIDVDATQLVATRAALQAHAPAPTLNDLILHTAARVLSGMPELNATVEGEALVLYEGVDVGVAVDTPRGLLVPVVRRADTLTVSALAAETRRLADAARSGRLGPADIGDASFTVSNLGTFGIRCGTPVINLGEPLLVFVGAVEERAVAVAGQLVIRPMCTLSIAYDHRVADGAAAARFTRGLKDALEALAVV